MGGRSVWEGGQGGKGGGVERRVRGGGKKQGKEGRVGVTEEARAQMTTDDDTAPDRWLMGETRAEDVFFDDEYRSSDSSSSDELQWNPRM